jgi:hypothetical protein
MFVCTHHSADPSLSTEDLNEGVGLQQTKLPLKIGPFMETGILYIIMCLNYHVCTHCMHVSAALHKVLKHVKF